MNALAGFHLDAVLGLAVLGLLIASKVATLRERKRAVEVDATVVQVTPRSRMTSYFVRYVFEGQERIAELRGAPMRTAYEVGAKLRVCIDATNPPDVALPSANASTTDLAIDGGSCTLPGTPLFSWWDAVYLAAAVILIVRSFS